MTPRIVAILLVGASLVACGERDRSLGWRIDFCPSSLADSAQTVEVEIRSGPCPGTMRIFDGSFDVAERGPPPPLLEPGEYAFTASAFDGRGTGLGRGCTDVVLPDDDGTVVRTSIASVDCGLVFDAGARPLDGAMDAAGGPCVPGLCVECIGGVARAPATDDACGTNVLECTDLDEVEARMSGDGRWEWVELTHGPTTRVTCAGVGVCEPPTLADCPPPTERVVATCDICEEPGGSPRSCQEVSDYSSCRTSEGNGRCVREPGGPLSCAFYHADARGGGSCNDICNPRGCACRAGWDGRPEDCGRNRDGIECWCSHPPGGC